jgi:hypothetical protein
MCDNDDIEVFEVNGFIIFQCKLCLAKWGRYDIGE